MTIYIYKLPKLLICAQTTLKNADTADRLSYGTNTAHKQFTNLRRGYRI